MRTASHRTRSAIWFSTCGSGPPEPESLTGPGYPWALAAATARTAAGPRPIRSGSRCASAACGSGEDAGEGVVEFAGVVEDALGELVDGPVDGREVVLHAVSQPGEDLVAVARGVEEVDRGAAGDAVAGGADVDGHIVHAEDVAGAQDRAPVLQVVGEVVQLALGALDEREVVRGLPAGHPAADDLGVFDAFDDFLGGLEVEY